jgi:gamma-glutamyltranspeptidase/glutathione hydrolase
MAIAFQDIERKFSPSKDAKCSTGRKGMVATQSPYASKAGREILKAGGNAVDAAVASALTLCVTEPQACGLGGQTMMIISDGKKTLCIDGSSRAPSLAHVSAIYKRDISLGYRATTVPSTPAALQYAQDRFGRLKWERVIQPAIQYAARGFKISELQHRLQVQQLKNFLSVSSHSGARYFLDKNMPYKSGTVFKQPELAALLKLIAEKGVQELYQGTTAKEIDADMRENGGLLRYDDLALIPWPIERKAIRKKFRGLTVYTMPPPGSGRALLFILQMLNAIPRKYARNNPVEKYLLFVNILRKALLIRSDRPYDPNFFAQVEDEKNMLDPRFARNCLRSLLDQAELRGITSIPTEDEFSGETTHLSVIDGNGLGVSLTQSIERVYGSKAAAAGLGFLYNNYLYDFDYSLPEHPYYLRPNAIPWATVAPSIIMNGNRIWMAAGSPGSSRIISSLALFLWLIADESMSIDQAVHAPRIHCSLGGKVSFEAERFDLSLESLLREQGFRIDRREPFAFYLGCIQAVLQKSDGSGFQGVADPRRDGTAEGV